MPTLAEYSRFVEDLEHGHYPACFQDSGAAINHLVSDICTAPWETAAERDKAQGLVARLERLRRLGAGSDQQPPQSHV